MKRRAKFEEVKPEMTPMIDVTFLLLIFFIVTLKFKTLEGRLDAALPKDRGTNTSKIEEIEKLDIVIKIANEGRFVPDPATRTTSKPQGRLNHYVGRVLNFEIGANTFRTPEEVRKFIKKFDPSETPVTIDPRKGTIYEDVVKILDVVIEEEFQQVAFAGSFEEE